MSRISLYPSIKWARCLDRKTGRYSSCFTNLANKRREIEKQRLIEDMIVMVVTTSIHWTIALVIRTATGVNPLSNW